MHQLGVHRPGRVWVVLLDVVELRDGGGVALRVQRIDAVVVQLLDRRVGRVGSSPSAFDVSRLAVPGRDAAERLAAAEQREQTEAGQQARRQRHGRVSRTARLIAKPCRSEALSSGVRPAHRAIGAHGRPRAGAVRPVQADGPPTGRAAAGCSARGRTGCATKRACSGAPASARSPTASSILWRTNSSAHAQPARVQHGAPSTTTALSRLPPRARPAACSPAISDARAKVRAAAGPGGSCLVSRRLSAWRADGRRGEVDRHRHLEASRHRRAQLGERLAVRDAHGAQHLDARMRRVLLGDAGAVQQEQKGAADPSSTGTPARPPRRRRCRRRRRTAPPSGARPCRPRLGVAGSRSTVHSRVSPRGRTARRCRRRGRCGGTRCRSRPAPAAGRAGSARRYAARRRRSRSARERALRACGADGPGRAEVHPCSIALQGRWPSFAARSRATRGQAMAGPRRRQVNHCCRVFRYNPLLLRITDRSGRLAAQERGDVQRPSVGLRRPDGDAAGSAWPVSDGSGRRGSGRGLGAGGGRPRMAPVTMPNRLPRGAAGGGTGAGAAAAAAPVENSRRRGAAAAGPGRAA